MKKKKNNLSIVFAVLTIVIGILLAFASGSIAGIIILIAGIFLAVNGVIGLISALKK